MPGLTNNLSEKTLCVREVRLQAANVMKVAPGILLLLIGELESICFFQYSNRREAKTEKKKREKSIDLRFFFICRVFPLYPGILGFQFSIVCLRFETFPEPIVEVENFIYRLPKR